MYLRLILLFSLAGSAISCGDGDYLPIPFSVTGTYKDYIGVYEQGTYKPIFIKGINLGVGVPGKTAGHLAVTRDQYRRWLQRLGEAGFNTLRIYTLHYPRFYEELESYNRAHPARPLYVLHGIWFHEDNPRQDLYTLSARFKENIEQAVDAVHGNVTIPTRHGRAFGEYTADISPWVIGWLIGREVDHEEILETDKKNAAITSYQGPLISMAQGSASEAWVAQHLEMVVQYERNRYEVDRPVGFSSWPTLDPLSHPTDDKGITSLQDVASLDVTRFKPLNMPAGIFASYHAYPYYPNFISDDPDYRKVKDSQGFNSYLGYLEDLKQYHKGMPLLVAEVGIPSSWGVAHYSFSGMNHGGHTEQEQGQHISRLLQNAYQANCGGIALFSWIDEWWKRTWITDHLDMPRERFPLWHNVTAAEQNFGFIAWDIGKPSYTQWKKVLGQQVQELETDADAAFFHLRLELGSPFSTGDKITIGFDTYRDDLGESMLPDKVKTQQRNELALVITAPDQAQLYVTEAYDLYGIWHKHGSAATQLFHSTATDGAAWKPVRWKVDVEHFSQDGKTKFPGTDHQIGKLRVRNNAPAAATNLDAVVITNNVVEVRIPWTLLQVTDPSTLSVMNDDRSTSLRETAVSKGIALSVSYKGELLETGRYKWSGWSEPPKTTEREKPSLNLFSSAMKYVPDYPNVR